MAANTSPKHGSTACRSPGRPRCMETHRTILASAGQMLQSMPYREISVERIAAHAGVGKQTIYRWYDSKADLILEAFLTHFTEALPKPVLSGDPVENLRDAMHAMITMFDRPMVASGYRALFAEAQFDCSFRQRFAEFVIKRRSDLVSGYILSAVQKKVIRDDIPPVLVVEALASPIMTHFLTGTEPMNVADYDMIFDMVLRGAAPVATPADQQTQAG